MEINFHNQVPVNIRNKKALVKTAKTIFSKEKKRSKSLSIIFCSDAYLLTINQQFLQHDTLTDIISFNYAGIKQPVIGELYISMDRVRENATLFTTTVDNERARVIFHGILHFCGFKDKYQSDKKIMKEKEEEYLALYNKNKN